MARRCFRLLRSRWRRFCACRGWTTSSFRIWDMGFCWRRRIMRKRGTRSWRICVRRRRVRWRRRIISICLTTHPISPTSTATKTSSLAAGRGEHEAAGCTSFRSATGRGCIVVASAHPLASLSLLVVVTTKRLVVVAAVASAALLSPLVWHVPVVNNVLPPLAHPLASTNPRQRPYQRLYCHVLLVVTTLFALIPMYAFAGIHKPVGSTTTVSHQC